jgi:hypothetical protein
MSASVESLLLRARRARWLVVVVVNLRFLIGFAFVPSGLGEGRRHDPAASTSSGAAAP